MSIDVNLSSEITVQLNQSRHNFKVRELRLIYQPVLSERITINYD